MRQRLPHLAAVFVTLIAFGAIPADGGTLPPPALSPATGTLPEDYLPALKLILANAVQRAPQAISASIDLAQAEISRYASAAPLWPSMSGSVSYAGTKETVSGGQASSAKGLYYSSNISQPIFEWGAFKYNYDIGKLTEEIGKRQFAEVYRQLATTIRAQYLALIVKKIGVRDLDFKLKLGQEAYNVAESNHKAGLISDADFSNYQLVLQDDEVAADRAHEEYTYAKKILMRLAGIDDLPDESLPLEVPVPKFSPELADALLNRFLAGGDETSFEVQVANMQIEQENLQYRIARSRLLPKFSAGAGYSVSNQTSTYPGTPATGNSAGTPALVSQQALTSINYGITGTWTIFDGFATREAKKSALAYKRAFERQRRTFIDQSVDNATDMRSVLGIASRDRDLSEIRGQLIDAAYRKAEDDLKHGAISPAALELVTMSTYESQFNRSSVRAQFFNHWCDFVSLTGMDPALDNLPFRYVR